MKSYYLLASILWITLPTNGIAQTSPAPMGRSRAEVKAEVEIWRESGLAQFDLAGEITPDPNSPGYRAAKARYEALRQSPQFAERVKKYEQQGR